jgi:aminopeptidase N
MRRPVPWGQAGDKEAAASHDERVQMNDEAFAPETTPHRYPPDRGLLPVHLTIHVKLDIEAKSAEVELTHRLLVKDPEKRTLVLDGVDVEDVVATGATLVSNDGQKLTLLFDGPVAKGETRELGLRYRVLEPRAGLYFSSPSAREPAAPRFAVTDHETERARFWLATLDHPSVRPTLEIAITSKDSDTILANGALVSTEAHGDGTKTLRYRLDAPCPSYLTAFAVGDFVSFEDGSHRDVPVAAYAPRPFEAHHLERTFRRTREMLAFCEARLGVPYPYPKYYQFAARGIGGAMENISLVSWDDRFLLDETLEREERLLADVINVHEMAHAWFGDHVVCRDYADAWLKEGWATYVESCWYEHAYGADDRDYDLYAHARAYFEELESEYQRPIVTRRYESSFDLFDRHLYPGAAIRIHMLRGLLGETAFWNGVKVYLERFGGREVETDDFRRCLEEASGRSLTRFFEQFFRTPGHPSLTVNFSSDAEQRKARFTVEQAPIDEKGLRFFAFPLELEVVGEDGKSARGTLEVSSRVQELTLDVAELGAPRMARVDPRHRVFAKTSFHPGRDMLLHQLEHASDLVGRIEAGVTLVDKDGRAGARAVKAAYERETHWGARVTWAEALGKAQSSDALPVLLELARAHDEPVSLPSLFRALGQYRDAAIVEVLSERLEGALSPRAEEAAYESLGKQRDRAPLERLLGGARSTSFGGFGARGALRGLGHSRKKEALEPLLASLEPGGSPEPVRPAAATALGLLHGHLEDPAKSRAGEALVDALRDPSTAVASAAASAIVSARVPGSEDALEAYLARVAHQDRSRLERARRAKKQPEPKDARLERLEDKLRKLEEQVARHDRD